MQTIRINDYRIICENGVSKFVLSFEDPSAVKPKKTEIILSAKEKHWKDVTFSYVGGPEIDYKIIPADPLQWGNDDFDILAIRLPRGWNEFFRAHAS